MADIEVDMAAVDGLIRVVLDSAESVSHIDCPTIDSNDLTGSSVVQAVEDSPIEAHLAAVAEHLRAWVDGARASLAAIEVAERQHAGRFGG